MAYIIVMDFSCMTICVWVVFKSKVEKNLKMIAVLKSVEGEASCTDERYLLIYSFLQARYSVRHLNKFSTTQLIMIDPHTPDLYVAYVNSVQIRLFMIHVWIR